MHCPLPPLVRASLSLFILKFSHQNVFADRETHGSDPTRQGLFRHLSRRRWEAHPLPHGMCQVPLIKVFVVVVVVVVVVGNFFVEMLFFKADLDDDQLGQEVNKNSANSSYGKTGRERFLMWRTQTE